jgi:hypothetical protein
VRLRISFAISRQGRRRPRVRSRDGSDFVHEFILSLHIRRLEQGPSEHEFPGEMSAFVLQKIQVQGLAGMIDAANATEAEPNPPSLASSAGIHKISDEIGLRISASAKERFAGFRPAIRSSTR